MVCWNKKKEEENFRKSFLFKNNYEIIKIIYNFLVYQLY